jgi:hypothetical protein
MLHGSRVAGGWQPRPIKEGLYVFVFSPMTVLSNISKEPPWPPEAYLNMSAAVYVKRYFLLKKSSYSYIIAAVKQ